MKHLLFGRAGLVGHRGEVERNHRRGRAELAGDGSEVITSDGADGAADVNDFRGGKVGRERGNHAAARQWQLNIAETQKRMAAKIDAIGLDSGDSAGGIDGGVALNENHPSHLAGGKMRVFRTRLGSAALRRNQAVALQLIGELLNGGGLKAGKNEGGFDGFKSGAGREAGASSGFTG